MINKYRLKIIYKEEKLTIDVEENISFLQLSKIINDALGFKDVGTFCFLDKYTILYGKNNEDKLLSEELELEQKISYNVQLSKRKVKVSIIVWDYIYDTDLATMHKFEKMLKTLNRARPKQVIYLNKGQKKFVDTILADSYDCLTSLSFSGIYNYNLYINNVVYLAVKIIYYILDDKYEIHIYNNINDLKEDNNAYLITYYETNRAYFKGYQGVNRNIFVLHGDKTLKKSDFVGFYLALNRIIFMLKDNDGDILFANHEKILNYDIATKKYWLEDTIE